MEEENILNTNTELTENIELPEEKSDTHIKVVDSYMGSGKTSWAILYINESSPDSKFIFITPYLKECNRVIRECEDKNFIQPDPRKGSGRKRNHFLKLIKDGKNIVSTHSLFSNIDDEIINVIRNENYELILDECFDVVERYDLYQDMPKFEYLDVGVKENFIKQDIKSLLAKKYISVDDDYRVVWNDNEDILYKYEPLKNLSNKGLLYLINDSYLLWSFPTEVFSKGIFEKIFILTFRFESQIQAYYYSYFNIEYEKYHIEKINDKYTLVKTENDNHELEWIRSIKPLIDICDVPSINRIGSYYINNYGNSVKTSLSKSWYKKNTSLHKKLSNNAVNFLRYYSNKESVDDIMWTCFIDFKDIIKQKGLSDKYFIPLNARATNDYREKKTLIYLINRYVNPFVVHFFNKKGIKLNQKEIARTELVQWMWRSRIREYKSISIYLPSQRERNLLIDYLNQV